MPSSKGKLPHLQGIRGVAIISVVLFHFFPNQFRNGYLGVDIFFLLSGYLMTMMLYRHDRLSLSILFDFWYRRVKRITPLYYLFIVILLVLLTYAEVSLQSVNVQSATIASLFATNLVRPNGMEGYFEKLGVAVDLFTHTWSLAVEMQFYLLFPFIYIISKFLPERLSYGFLYAITLVSFVFHCRTDVFTSFNSLFSRIWQFNAGMLSYLFVNKAVGPDEKESLIENRKTTQIGHSGSIGYCFGAILVLLFCPREIDAYFARFIITLLTMTLLQFGNGNPILENRLLVLVGEVSYSWYLAHWPMVAYIRHVHIDTLDGQFAALAASFLLSLILHFAFERKYLQWERSTIIVLLVFLVVTVSFQVLIFKMNMATASIEATQNLKAGIRNNESGNLSIGKDNYPSDYLKGIVYGYEEERAAINTFNQVQDINISMGGQCAQKKTPNPREYRCEMNKAANPTSPFKALVIGNSWAGNIVSILSSECSHNFSHLEFSFTAGCEALVQSHDPSYDCSYDYMFHDALKEVKPDVLFVIERHIQMMEIKNGTNPFDDENFEIASNRFSELQKLVSRRIFILDAFPEVTDKNIFLTNNFLKKNQSFTDEKAYKITQRYLTAKLRLARLVEKCRKCRLFDFTPQFFVNGIFRTYDPKYFVSYFTMGQHLTPSGWERVRPLFRHLCDTF